MEDNISLLLKPSNQDLVSSSFFDDISEEQEKQPINYELLWLNQQQFKESIIGAEKAIGTQILYEGFLHRQNPSSQDLSKYYFVLYEDRLICYNVKLFEFNDLQSQDQTKTKQLGIMKLTGIKIEFSEGKIEQNEAPFLFLSRNKYYEILAAQSLEIFQIWQSKLKQTCVLTQFGKSYLIQKVIGKGTFAKVILAKRISDNAEFAVKTFQKDKILSSKSSTRTILGLHNEIQIMRQLNHPNIIKLHEVYEGEEHVYFVLDLLTGGELFDKLIKSGVYSEGSACRCITKLLCALDYLHSKGIMHRDIKPENLILRNEHDNEDIILADFGLSEHENKPKQLFKRLLKNKMNQQLTERCGTPGYVAPEILFDQKYDCKVDVFSAGVILYILLTGYSPFYGKSYNEILQKNKKCEINFKFDKIQISPTALDLLQKMLARNQKDRITAKECLNHPWIKNIEMQSQEEFSENFSSVQENIKKFQDEKFNVKAIKPAQMTDSQDIIMNSPLITGKRNSIGTSSFQNSPIIPTKKKQTSMYKQVLLAGAKGSKNVNENAKKK